MPAVVPPSARLRAAFAAVDVDRSGEVDTKELCSLFAKLGVERTPAQCEELLSKADGDKSGSLTIDEVASLFESAKLAQTFEELDADGSGTIQSSELGSALQKLGYNLGERECAELLAKVDANRDGEVSFEEFRAFFEFVPLASLSGIAEHLLGQVHLDVGSDLAPPVPRGKDIPVWECLGVGGVAGVVSRTLTAPLERVKLAAQTGGLRPGASILGELKRVAQTEGPRALFAGNGANCIRVFPVAGIVTLCYVRLLKALPCDDEFDPAEPFWRGLAGASAGIVGSVLTYPIDVVRARLTVDGARYDHSVMRCVRAIAAEGGGQGGNGSGGGVWRMGGFFRGLTPTLCAVAPFLALQQSAYDTTKRLALDAGAAASVPLFLACSMTAGAVAQTAVYPLDLIRRRIQMGAAKDVSGSAAVIADSTWLASLRNVVAKEGFRGAFAGIGPTYATVIPSVMITKTAADTLIAYGDRHGWRG